jgi:hypothetical protein
MLIIGLRQTTSLKKFGKKRACGQIATFLMLIMVVILMLILVTVNLGRVAVDTTNIANAADNAALMLGSMMATKANAIHSALKAEDGKNDATYYGPEYNINDTKYNPYPKLCRVDGILDKIFSAILSILTVIAIIVISALTGGTASFFLFVCLGTLAGGFGGWLGAKIQGTNPTNGAIAGAKIGFAVGATAAGFYSMATTAGEAAAAQQGAAELTAPTTTVSEAGYDTATGFSVTSTETLNAVVPWIEPAVLPAVTPVAQTIGLAATATVLDNLMKILPEYEAMKSVSKAFKKLSDDISGLPEADMYRESVFFQALSQTVNDPTETKRDTFGFRGGPLPPFTDWKLTIIQAAQDCPGANIGGPSGGWRGADPCDLDYDGDYNEAMPIFLYWWQARVLKIRQISSEVANKIHTFVTDKLVYAGQYIDAIVSSGDRCGDNGADDCPWSQLGGEWHEFLRGRSTGNKNSLVGFGKKIDTDDLGSARYKFRYWNPGSDPDYKDDAMDEAEYAVSFLRNYLDLIISVSKKWLSTEWDSYKGRQVIIGSWNFWLPSFYTPELYNFIYGNNLSQSDPNYYSGLNGRARWYQDGWYHEIKKWREDLSRGGGLPDCIYNGNHDGWTNAPCKRNDMGSGYYLSWDNDLDNEFEVVWLLDELITRLNWLRGDAQWAWNQIYQVYLNSGLEFLANPTDPNSPYRVAYAWGGADNNDHKVTVTLKFKMPIMYDNTPNRSWWKQECCFYLQDYQDATGENTWVQITRQDPAGLDPVTGERRRVGPGGLLGFWNPYDNIDPYNPENSANNDGKFSVTKFARVSWRGLGRWDLFHPSNAWVDLVEVH